jgi:hypothetical protein
MLGLSLLQWVAVSVVQTLLGFLYYALTIGVGLAGSACARRRSWRGSPPSRSSTPQTAGGLRSVPDFQAAAAQAEELTP